MHHRQEEPLGAEGNDHPSSAPESEAEGQGSGEGAPGRPGTGHQGAPEGRSTETRGSAPGSVGQGENEAAEAEEPDEFAVERGGYGVSIDI